MRLRYFLLFFVLLASIGLPQASAQSAPEGADLLAAWRSGWERSMQSLGVVNYVEASSRTIEGPRGVERFGETVDVRLSGGGGMDRTVQRSEFNGQRIATVRMTALDRRLRLAYGAGFDWVSQPPIMPLRLAGAVRPSERVVADVVGDARAWRLVTEPGQPNNRIERVTFWFAQVGNPDYPRLLRMQVVGRVPSVARRIQGGSAIITTDFARVREIDVPRRTETEVVIRQIRRRRVFTVLMSADVVYSAPSFTRR